MASERRADYLHEAASLRLTRLARSAAPANPSAVRGGLRGSAGLALIRIGGWLQGSNDFAPLGAQRRDTFA
jgi:hypothetical protein